MYNFTNNYSTTQVRLIEELINHEEDYQEDNTCYPDLVDYRDEEYEADTTYYPSLADYRDEPSDLPF